MTLHGANSRVVVEVDMQFKNSHTFENGQTIRIERGYDNFDQKHVAPVNATVMAADNIPVGAECICHHNITHEVNRLSNYKSLSGKDIASEIKYFSIPENEVYAWRVGEDEWQPATGFAFALRVFKPYSGPLQGIEPTLLPNCLYLTTGKYKGQVCRTVKAADYTIIFQDNGRERRLIRCRPDGDEKTQREPELIAIDHDLTEKVASGKYLIGLTKTDAQCLKN